MLKGTRCCWLTPGSEQQIETSACLACAAKGTNPCGYPLPMLRLMTRDRDPKVVSCSATMIPGCPREHGLKKHQDWYVHPDRAYTRAFGSTVHIALEKLHNPMNEAVVETRYSREHTLPDGRVVTVTAQLDTLYFVGEKEVVINDYKVVATLAPSKLARKVQNYIPQMSVQRWLVEHYGFRAVDVTLTFLSHEGRRVVSLLDDESDTALWTASETEQYLDARLPALVASLDGNLTDPLSDPDEFWRCRYCDCQTLCEQQWGKPLPFRGLHATNPG